MTTAAQHNPNAFSITANAMVLADHVITITDNLNTFPDFSRTKKKNQDGTVTEILVQREDCITNMVRRQAVDIYLSCCKANSIDATREPGRKEERLSEQRKAMELCKEHMIMIQLCKKHFHLNNAKVMYWGKMTRDLMIAIAKWNNSDKDRYKNI